MTRNVGGVDRAVRLIIGFGLIVASLVSPVGAAVRIAMFVVAGVALLTAFTGF